MLGDDTPDTGCTESDQSTGEPGSDGGAGVTSSRRSLLAGVVGLAAGGLAVGSGSARWKHADVPVPRVEGPIEGGTRTGGPQYAAPLDLAGYGYVEEEYFLSGEARHDDFFADGEQADATAEYKTRILVYRPVRPSAFDGAVYAEWFNVSTQVDAAVAWPNAYETLMRDGTAVVLVSAQKVGVDDSALGRDLVTWDPARYGSLHHPGDRYALDIFAQVANVLGLPGRGWARRRGDPDPMANLHVEDVLATGHSQSAFFLLRYINLVAPEYGVVDGFVPAGSPLTTALADQAPILWLNSEDEAAGLAGFGDGDDGDDGISIPTTGLRLDQIEPGPRDDEGLFTLWEVAGASHVNNWLSQWTGAIRRRDFRGLEPNWDPDSAGDYGQQPDGIYGECGFNYFPARYAWRGALEQLREWVARGDEPPRADRLVRTVDDEGNVVLVRDEFGNAVGGLRLPPIDVPVATYEGSACGLVGRTTQLDAATLADLYPSNDAYVVAIRDASIETVLQGHMLPGDAKDLIARAEASSIGE